MCANYVDKETFLTDIRAYKERKKNNPDEQIPNYSAEAIKQIATRLANRPNFVGYSYRDDMVSDGMYVCLKYFDKYDPLHQKNNPFGYFSQICWFAFLQRIAKEKKQTAIKSKILAMMPFDLFDVQDQDVDEDFKNSFTEFLQEHNHVDIEPKKKAKKKKSTFEECLTDDLIIVDGPEIEAILALSVDVDTDD